MNAYCILWSSKQSACMTEELTSHIFSECSFSWLQLIWKSYTDNNSSRGLAPIFLSVDDIFNFLPQLILVVIRWLQSSIMLQWLSYCLPIVCLPVELTESYLGFYFVPTLEKLSCQVSSQPHDMSFWLLWMVWWCYDVWVCLFVWSYFIFRGGVSSPQANPLSVYSCYWLSLWHTLQLFQSVITARPLLPCQVKRRRRLNSGTVHFLSSSYD